VEKKMYQYSFEKLNVWQQLAVVNPKPKIQNPREAQSSKSKALRKK
jgi:hypothetical protein